MKKLVAALLFAVAAGLISEFIYERYIRGKVS